MKLATKYLITLGGISATAAGAIGYGAYSAVKFDEKFQGVGWYYNGHKYTTKLQATIAFKEEVRKGHSKYYDINFSLISKPKIGGGTGTSSNIGGTSHGTTIGSTPTTGGFTTTIEFDKPNNKLKISQDSSVGQKIKSSSLSDKEKIIKDELIGDFGKMFELHYEKSATSSDKYFLVISYKLPEEFGKTEWIMKSKLSFDLGFVKQFSIKEILNAIPPKGIHNVQITEVDTTIGDVKEPEIGKGKDIEYIS